MARWMHIFDVRDLLNPLQEDAEEAGAFLVQQHHQRALELIQRRQEGAQVGGGAPEDGRFHPHRHRHRADKLTALCGEDGYPARRCAQGLDLPHHNGQQSFDLLLCVRRIGELGLQRTYQV